MVEILEKQVGCISGGFDPLHVGHIHLIKSAYSYFCKNLIVILNSDEWLKRNKGFVLMPWNERKEIISEIRGVQEVTAVKDNDDTVCEALKRIRPNLFINGGFRTQYNTPERELCKDLGIKLIWGVGGGTSDKYTELIDNKIRKT